MFRQAGYLVISIFGCILLLFLSACAVTPPVQEMSNARQTIQAAKDAGAEQYASEKLIEAQQLLDRAGQYIDDKDYFSARNLALEAKEQAMQARQMALQKKQTE